MVYIVNLIKYYKMIIAETFQIRELVFIIHTMYLKLFICLWTVFLVILSLIFV